MSLAPSPLPLASALLRPPPPLPPNRKGWYGFNPGSQLAVSGANAVIVARVAVTTTLSAAAAGCTGLFLQYLRTGTWDLMCVCNAMLGGLVGVTAGCSVLEPWAALLCGFTSAIVFVYAEKGLLALKIDDPVSAIPIHLCCGAWGVIYVGIMAAPRYVVEVYGAGTFVEGSMKWGIFYGGNAQLLLCQFIEVLVIVGWVGFFMLAFFMAMSKMGLLRVSPEEELAGLDVSKHGGSAYAGAEVGGGDGMSHSKSVAEGVVRF